KVILTLSVALALNLGFNAYTYAQEAEQTEEVAADLAQTEAVEEEVAAPVAEQVPTAPEEVVEESFHQVIKTKFIEGGAEFMGVVLICLILGLALAIERIIYLN